MFKDAGNGRRHTGNVFWPLDFGLTWIKNSRESIRNYMIQRNLNTCYKVNCVMPGNYSINTAVRHSAKSI